MFDGRSGAPGPYPQGNKLRLPGEADGGQPEFDNNSQPTEMFTAPPIPNGAGQPGPGGWYPNAGGPPPGAQYPGAGGPPRGYYSARPPVAPPPLGTNRSKRRDPASIVLLVAVIVMLVSVTAFALVATNVFGSLFAATKNQQGSTVQTPVSTPGNGAASASPTAAPTATPIPTPSPTVAPTPTPTPMPTATPTVTAQEPLKIISAQVPTQVTNNTTVQIVVVTNQPNVKVHLLAVYSVSPYLYTGKTHTTDANGNVTLNWSVHVSSGFGNVQQTATATLQIFAQNQKGEQTVNDPPTVQILLK